MVTRSRKQTKPLTKPAWGLALLFLAGVAVQGVAAGASADESSDLAEARTEVAVRLALLDKLGTDALHIGIDVDGSTVTLTGKVRTRATQELAQEVALGIDRVTAVSNRITVTTPPTASESKTERAAADVELELKDAVLESRVKFRLIDTIGVKAFKVEVEATEGVVSLRGTLPSSEHRTIALETTRKTNGVRKVIDLLKVD